MQVARELMDRGAHVHIYDTVKGALENFKIENPSYEGKYSIYHEQYEMVNGNIDGLIIGNEHEKFRNPDVNKLDTMRGKHIFDGKNILNNFLTRSLTSKGFNYKSVGKDTVANPVNKTKLIDFLKHEYMD